jgi:hypothetical protein
MVRVRKLKKKSLVSKRFVALVAVSVMLLSSIVAFFSFLPTSKVVKAQDDYTFGSETVNKGYSTNPTGKNTEDGTYESLTEADQYPDTNF